MLLSGDRDDVRAVGLVAVEPSLGAPGDPALHVQGLLQNALRGLQVAEALVQTAQRVQRRGDVRVVGLVAVESQVRGALCYWSNYIYIE